MEELKQSDVLESIMQDLQAIKLLTKYSGAYTLTQNEEPDEDMVTVFLAINKQLGESIDALDDVIIELRQKGV